MARKSESSDKHPPLDNQYEDFVRGVGHRIREARSKIGLTQTDFAKKISRSQPYMFEIETGSVNLSLRALARIADALGLEPRELLPEGSRLPPTTLGLDRFETLLKQLVAALSERRSDDERREIRDARRRAEDAALLAAFRELPALRFVLERDEAISGAVGEERSRGTPSPAEHRGSVPGKRRE